MPVQTIPTGPGKAARFIVCDKRSDINRVALTTAHVDQWKCDAEALARFVVEQVGLRRSRHRADASGTRYRVAVVLLWTGWAEPVSRDSALCGIVISEV